MSTKDNGGPAFPHTLPGHMIEKGMTLRDYFAAKAMQGQLSGTELEFTGAPIPDWQLEDLVKCSYQIADAMLEVRQK